MHLLQKLTLTFALAAQLTTASAEIIRFGPGSYTTHRPAACKALPERIYTSDSFQQPIITNQWWSSLLWQPYSQPMFAHPLGMRATAEGLAVSYPGTQLGGNARTITAGPVTQDGDLKIGHSTIKHYSEALCDDYSDWQVTARFSQGDASLRTAFGHGSPFVFCEISGGDPIVSFPNKPLIWLGDSRDHVIGVTINGSHYGLFGAKGSSWSGMDGTRFTNHANGASYFSIALLPDATAETLALFKRYAYSHITDTRVSYKVANGTLKTTYHFTVEAHEGSENSTLFALYPHQWKYTTAPLSDLSYQSVRGQMKVGSGHSFQTEVPIQGILPMLPAEGIEDKARLIAYLQAEADKPPVKFADTYWEGKYLGQLASLSGIAEAAGAPQLQQVFLGEIKRRLENWFTANSDEAAPLFYYDQQWGTLIGSRPSYGSADQLNDHHFHYGYFIRAAAEVARKDKDWAKQWSPMVTLLIREIASPNRQDPMFPYIRCFDKYAGHSWASGHANFGDGNNQESSSESINAWYGMILWGEAMGDTTIRDTGLFLFNTERIAVEEYWFDVNATNFPDRFEEVALGMVWGGKGDFATWFSADVDCIHGINWLPFTPASLYMGRHPDYVQTNYERIVSLRKGGTDFSTGWGDLVVMFNALSDPAMAANYIDTHPQCKLEGGNTHAFMYHWIHTLNRLGLNDAEVTADHPFSIVFNKGDTLTYSAYNFGSEPRTVRFSDGTTLQAEPHTLTTTTR